MKQFKKEVHSENLEKLVTQIVNLVNPKEVILFGSNARGEAKPHSDLDLMVIMPEGIHRRYTAQKIYRFIKGVTQPFDIIVATPSDLKKYKDDIGFIYHTALKQGISVYSE